jgi:uncharacterized RDD family membrane protein YckC
VALPPSGAIQPSLMTPGLPPPPVAKVTGDQRLPAGIEVASPWVRLGAHLLNALLVLVTLVIGWVVWTIVVWGKGQNPGQRILGLRVVEKQTGEAATRGQMFVRNFLIYGLLLSIIGSAICAVITIVAVLMIFSAYRETLWDKMAGTLVVKDPEGVTLSK